MARHITPKHPMVLDTSTAPGIGQVQFANWENLLESLGCSLLYFTDFIATPEIIPIKRPEDMLKYKHLSFYATPNA